MEEWKMLEGILKRFRRNGTMGQETR